MSIREVVKVDTCKTCRDKGKKCERCDCGEGQKNTIAVDVLLIHSPVGFSEG